MSDSLIPIGNYRGVAVPTRADGETEDRRVHLATTKNGSNQSVAYFEIISGEHSGRRSIWRGSWSGGAAQYTAKALRAMGMKGNSPFDEPDENYNQIVSLAIRHEEYEGKTYARIAFVSPEMTLKIKKPNIDEARRWSASMAASMASVPLVDGKTYEVPAETAGSDAQDDDIPF